MKRTINAPDTEPDQKQFALPTEKEHLFSVTDIYEFDSPIGMKLGLDQDTVSVKAEVTGGEEEGRSLLIRLSFNPDWAGFFATRLFLKAIGLPHKGQIDIDTDQFQGRQFYATVVHNDKYANIDKYNFDKIIEQPVLKTQLKKDESMAWDD